MPGARDYDLVLLGATGFTGGLVAEDLTRRAAGTGIRWAIAGRNADKLARLREDLKAIDPDGAPTGTQQVEVDDLTGLLDLAAKTRALATTVGPYAELGELVVQACIRSGTDYLDITGEPAFVNLLLKRYDTDARRNGVRVVNCCGFDSIPHDLGAQFTVEQLSDDAPITLRGFVSAGGRPSGGTLASAIGAMGDRDSLRGTRPDPGAGRRVSSLPRAISRVPEIDGWAVPMPTVDPQVILRSAAADPSFGPDFRYGHFARAGSVATAAGLVGGVGGMAALAQLGAGRKLLSKLLTSPGDGPDEATREAGWFRVSFLGQGGGVEVRTEVRGGDPGYTETARMLTESALCLLQDGDRLPETAGVVTTATAMGAVLRERLQARGMRFEVISRTA